MEKNLFPGLSQLLEVAGILWVQTPSSIGEPYNILKSYYLTDTPVSS